jgi:hypothetical protein
MLVVVGYKRPSHPYPKRASPSAAASPSVSLAMATRPSGSRHCECRRGTEAMVRENEVREAELTIEPPAATDAGVAFIGRTVRPGPPDL